MKKLFLLVCLSMSAHAAFMPKGFEADFNQITKTLKGQKAAPVKVIYKYRSNIFFDVQGDSPSLYICNKDKVWVYLPPFDESEPGEVKIGDSSKYCYSKLFDTLAGGLKDNPLYQVKRLDTKAELFFSKDAAAQLSMQKVVLEFGQKLSDELTLLDVKKIELFRPDQKDPLLLEVKTIKQKNDIPDSTFTFDPPKNTNITHMK